MGASLVLLLWTRINAVWLIAAAEVAGMLHGA